MSELILNPQGPFTTDKFTSEIDNGVKAAQVPPAVEQEILDYKKYEDRIKSFVGWPNKNVKIEDLASAGFYYKKHDDVVKCPFCEIEGHQWLAGDNPLNDHKTWCPNCPFIMMSVEHDSSSDGVVRTVDTCGLYGVEILPNSVPDDERQIADLEKLAIPNKGPVHPDKISYESRLRTYALWPKSIRQTPHSLAEAGFFYLGIGDQTLCFHCGGGLKDWEADDNPWEEHALWFPKCAFLLIKRGHEYIEQVKHKRDPKASHPETSYSTETKENTEELSVTNCESVSEVKGTDKPLCKICFKNELCMAFLPCRHIVACADCTVALKNCAVCRKPIEATVRMFIS